MLLIICEKPSVAESFAKALGAKKNKNYYSNQNCIITNCVGHMYALAKPEAYLNDSQKRITIDQLPVIPQNYKYVKNPKTLTQLNTVLMLLQENRNARILLATDADREGEVIGRELLKFAGISDTSQVFRFWVSEALTPDVIIKGMKTKKLLSNYDYIANKGFARQHADWLVGMNFSNFITLNNTEVFSVGRVQTSLLSVIAERNKEIEEFKPVPYSELELTLKDADNNVLYLYLLNKNEKRDFNPDSEYLKKAFSYFKTNPTLEFCQKTENKKTQPPKLFCLTDISKIAADKFNFSPTKTLEIIQKLYEDDKCVSYPRTPSSVMGDDDVELYKDIYAKLKNNYKYSNLCNPAYINPSYTRVFNSRLLEAHHALIPLSIPETKLTDDEKKIYTLIFNSFFQAIMEPFEFQETEYTCTSGEFVLSGKIKKITKLGWMESNQDFSEENYQPGFNIDSIKITDIKILNKETEPKKQFTEASLLAFMKNPQNSTTEEKLVGLGTEATRAEIIKKLFEKNYITKNGKSLFATNKAHYLLKILNKNDNLKKITDVKQTTEWEKKLDENPFSFEEEIKKYVAACINKSINFDKFEGNNYGTCPVCHKGKILKNKWNYFCSLKDSGCKARIPLEFCSSKITEADLKLLLEGKKTRIHKMKSKNGKDFTARIKINITNKMINIELEFENKKK